MTEPQEISTAIGLVERYAAAFASGMPDHPEDDGFFGPASVTWRLSADLSAPVAGLRSVLIQALHPLAMAGVDQHSDWRRDPVGRLAATSTYLATITYGDRASADRAAGPVRAIHEHVRGVDTVTGQPYAAGDPALLLWVHAALVDSVLAAARAVRHAARCGGRRPATSAEMAVAAELLGVPREIIPASVAALDGTSPDVRPELRCTPAAAESMGYLLDPPGLDEEIAELWQDIRDAAVAALPGWAREMYGYPAPPPLTPDAPGRRSARPWACSTPCSSPSRACSRRGSGSPLRMRGRHGNAVRTRARKVAGRSGGRTAGRGGPALRRGVGCGGPAVAALGRRTGACGSSAAWRRCGWPRAAARGTRAARRGCSPPRASTGSSCATTWPCRPPRTSPPPWAR